MVTCQGPFSLLAAEFDLSSLKQISTFKSCSINLMNLILYLLMPVVIIFMFTVCPSAFMSLSVFLGEN